MNSKLLKANLNDRRKQPDSEQQAAQSSLHNQLLQSDSYLRAWASEKAQQGSYTEAIALLNQLLHRDPQNAIDYNNRGLVYFQAGEFQQAIADYNKALELNPRLAKAFNNRANYFAACGDLLTAIADYDRALDLNPSYARAWLNRGITLRDLERYAEAVENFDFALLLGQIEGHIYAERGRTYHLWGDWNCCIADYRRALALLPQLSGNFDSAMRLRLQVETWLAQLLDTATNF